MKNSLTTGVVGNVKIYDGKTKEILVHKDNAIHVRNMAIAIARGLANSSHHQIYRIVLGNGGTTVDSSANVFYNSPNVTGASAFIYNKTYEEIVDEQSSAPAGNMVENFDPPTSDSTVTTVMITVTLTSNEPAGQNPTDEGPTNVDSGTYVFDELGLVTSDPVGPTTSPDGGLLLSHLIFSPIEKSANREIVIEYTLTITVE